ncbi:MAG: TatD family hydrolase [Desulfatitalea sp.]|nr:TatD family hydrolase [Desulfatitalea sp.]
MNIFDSHCHLDDRGYDRDLDGVIQRAHQADVKAMMAVGIDLPTSRKAIAIAERYDGVYAAVGLHPHDAKSGAEASMAEMQAMAAHPKVKAWGEIGLDFNRMYSPQPDQERWFLHQLALGETLNLPMIFHERDSGGRFLKLLRTHWAPLRQGVVHCFSGSEADLDAYLSMDLHIGITGILTIQSRGQALRQMARRIPANRLLVETDAPYLTPTPERNKFRRNEPAFVRTVLFKLAEIRQADPADLAETIWTNTCRLFDVDACECGVI